MMKYDDGDGDDGGGDDGDVLMTMLSALAAMMRTFMAGLSASVLGSYYHGCSHYNCYAYCQDNSDCYCCCHDYPYSFSSSCCYYY